MTKGNKKYYVLVALVLAAAMLVLTVLPGCKAAEAPPTKVPWPSSLVATSPAEGTTGYVVATTVAKIITKAVPGVSATSQPTGSAMEAATLVVAGEAQLCSAGPAEYTVYYNNDKEWAPQDGAGLMRQAFGGYKTNLNIFVRADSDIKTIADLKGKKFACLSPGYPLVELAWRAILGAYGIKKEDLTLLTWTKAAQHLEQLRDKSIDAFMQHSALGETLYKEASRTMPLREVAVDPAKVPEIQKIAPWLYSVVAPAGTYNGMTEDTPILGLGIPIAIRKSVPNDLAYAIVKAVADNLDDLRAAHVTFKNITVADLATDMVVPWHPGAYQFFKDQGIVTPENEKRYRDLLAKMGQTD